VPTAGCQSFDDALGCGALVHVKGLWIELGCERFDALFFDADASGAVRLPYGVVVLTWPKAAARKLLFSMKS
jgi:hypothetical protein